MAILQTAVANYKIAHFTVNSGSLIVRRRRSGLDPGTEPGLGTRYVAGTLNGIGNWNRNPEWNPEPGLRFQFPVPFLVLLWNRNVEQNHEWN